MLIGFNSNPGAPLPGCGSLLRVPAWQLTPEAVPLIRAAGLEPVLVLDRASCTAWGWLHGSFRGTCLHLATRYPDIRLVEAGNEPDGAGDASSRQSKADFYALIAAARFAWPHATIISGGLVYVDFSYLDGVQAAGADVAGLHPYAQDSASVAGLIAACQAHTALPIWATEFGTDVIRDPHERAVWHSGLLVGLWQAGVEAAIVYRYSDDGSGFTVAGTESEAAVADAIPNLGGAAPPPQSAWRPYPDPWDSIELVTAGFTPGAQCAAVFGVRRQILSVVIHDMEGYEPGAVATWNQGKASANISILRDGHAVLNVHPEDVAWHAGTDASTGRTAFWRQHNVNPYSLGLELEGFSGQAYSGPQGVTIRRIALWAEAVYQVPRVHTMDQLGGWHAHSEISNQRSDPGMTFDWSWVMG